MFQEGKSRGFRAEIPNEIRARAGEDPSAAVAARATHRRASVRTVARVVSGAALVVGAVLLGAIAGLVTAGAALVLVLRAASSAEGDR